MLLLGLLLFGLLLCCLSWLWVLRLALPRLERCCSRMSLSGLQSCGVVPAAEPGSRKPQ